MNSFNFHLVLENKKHVDDVLMFLALSENIGLDLSYNYTVNEFNPFSNNNVIGCLVNSKYDIYDTHIKLVNFCQDNDIYFYLMLMHDDNSCISSNYFSPNTKPKTKIPHYLRVVK